MLFGAEEILAGYKAALTALARIGQIEKMSVLPPDTISHHEITLDKSSRLFIDGEVVTGKVVTKPFFLEGVRGIRVEARGVASVFFDKSKHENSNLSKTDKFFSWSKVFDKEIKCKDQNSFEFKFKLPKDVPSSFDGAYGSISYDVVLILMEKRESTVLTSTTFTVLAGLELSYVPEAAAKIDICKYKESGWCCFEDMTTVRWKVDVSGYVSKDIITIRTFVEEDNSHNVTLKETILFKMITYKMDKKKKTERIEVARATMGLMLRKDGSMERIEFLTIPSVPSTGSTKYKFFNLSYELEFKAEIVGSARRELAATAEIFIGSEPIDFETMKNYVATKFNQHHLKTVTTPSYATMPSAPSLFFMDFCPSVSEVGSIERQTPPPSYDVAVCAEE